MRAIAAIAITTCLFVAIPGADAAQQDTFKVYRCVGSDRP